MIEFMYTNKRNAINKKKKQMRICLSILFILKLKLNNKKIFLLLTSFLDRFQFPFRCENIIFLINNLEKINSVNFDCLGTLHAKATIFIYLVSVNELSSKL